MGCTLSKSTSIKIHASTVESIPSLKGFEGKVFFRDYKNNSDYDIHRYQYAYSSHLDGSISPAMIFYARHEEDIKKVIRYAKEKNIAIAARTGGHQYSGASSTSGKNIQLDLSQAFLGEENFQYDKESNRLRVGISFPLKVFNKNLADKGLFIPHGECENVHLGGHVQTGGSGQLLRAFGLFCDHVRAIEIITADCEKKIVTRESHPDLFFAVLGGSPGNFGILTHVVIEPLRDEDYPHSRGLFGVYLYDADRLKRLLNLSVEMANDDNLPIDYDYTVSVISFNQDIVSRYPNLDDMMRKNHPDEFSGLGKEASVVEPSVIVVFAQWANTKGSLQAYTDDVAAWFDRVKATAHGLNLSKVAHVGAGYVGNDQHVPMSELSKHWMLLKVREYELPYVKRAYSTSEKVGEDWIQSFVHHVDEVQSNLSGTDCKICVQVQQNSKNNKVIMNKDNGTSYSWRDTRIGFACDIFYGPTGHAFAEKWQARNDSDFIGESGNFSKQDRRWFWGSYGNTNLNEMWPYYYDSEEKYHRILKVKNEIDPEKIFSPNQFCIGGAKNIMT